MRKQLSFQDNCAVNGKTEIQIEVCPTLTHTILLTNTPF